MILHRQRLIFLVAEILVIGLFSLDNNVISVYFSSLHNPIHELKINDHVDKTPFIVSRETRLV